MGGNYYGRAYVTVFLSDNGVQFKSHVFNGLLQKYGVQHASTAQANASERVNRSILAGIYASLTP